MKGHHSLYITLILLISTWFFSCSTDESLEIRTLRDFDIYANDTLNNVFVFDMVPTSQGFLIAAICGTSQLSNKFSGDGRIYLLEVDDFGNVLWEENCRDPLFESGYPSNLITTNDQDQFLLFWNEFNGNLKSIPLTTGISPDSSAIKQLDCNGCRADVALMADDHVYSLGLSEGNTGPITVINEFDLDFNSSRSLTQKSFDASRFGGFGLTDLNFVNRINNYIHLESNALRLIFSGPSDSDMILSHVGELIPEYSSEDLWIADIAPNPDLDESFSIIFQDPGDPQSQSIFISKVDLSGLPGESSLATQINESKLRFSSMDPDLPQFIIKYNSTEWVIIGTSLNGLPTIVRINTETGKIVRSRLGDLTRLNIAKAELKQGELYLSGTTIVNNRFQRPFLLRISEQDIF